MQHYAGDALLAAFRGVADAVRCAVETQRSLAERNLALAPERRVEFRIGVNAGDVIVSRGEIFGDEVNIAARLEGFARPGGICISERVHDAIDPALGLALAYLGERRLKNIGRRIGVYRLDVGTVGGSPNSASPGRDAGPAARLDRPQQPSLAVLPFRDLGETGISSGFAEGLTLDLMTGLVKLSGLFLASDYSTFCLSRPSSQRAAGGR